MLLRNLYLISTLVDVLANALFLSELHVLYASESEHKFSELQRDYYPNELPLRASCVVS